jgi:acetyl esterase
MRNLLTIVSLAVLSLPSAYSQSPKPKGKKAGKAALGSVKLTQAPVKAHEVVYKSTPQGELKLHVYAPAGETQIAVQRPCIVFFFGGGWKSGSFKQFVPQAEYLASRGIVAACADYRIRDIHKTTPDKAVEDAKSAIRWVRGHAVELGIDPGKVIATGGSAGGHLAACTALCKAYDGPTDDLTVSAKPNAMVLFNPAMNIATLFRQRKEGKEGIEMAEAITPNSFVTKDTPPAILFFGGADDLKVGGDEYIKLARTQGLRAEMWVAPGMPHGFFNQEPWLQVTAQKMEQFLSSLGYLSGESALQLPTNAPTLTKE